MKVKIKDLTMIGIIIGIAFFFIGAIISNVVPSNQTNLISYKVSTTIKLLGIGALTSSMIIGGIIIEGIDKNLKILLLLFGLILLMIYTVGAQSLQWNIPLSGIPSESQSYESRPTGYGMPGFEVLFAFLAIIIVLFFLRKQHHR